MEKPSCQKYRKTRRIAQTQHSGIVNIHTIQP